MPPAVAAAGIMGAATIGGAVMSSKAAKKSASKAAQVSQQNTNANNALARENRDFAFGVLEPYRQVGLPATNVLSGMLYGAPQQPALAAPSTAYPGFPYAASAPGVAPELQTQARFNAGMAHDPVWAEGALKAMGLGSRGDPVATLNAHLNGQLEGELPGYVRQRYEAYAAQTPQAGVTPALAPAGTVTTTAPQSAWDTFRNSTNYQFRFDEGMKALNQGLAFHGLGDSGAAVKEATKYGQNFASNELNNYINLLLGQQNVGMGAASAMVGVGQNTTNAIMANNTNNATDQANAALMKSNATAGMWNGIANGVGIAAGALGSSYGSSALPRIGPMSGTTGVYSGRGGVF